MRSPALFVLCIGGALIVCDGIPLERPTTTRASIIGRSLVSTTKAYDKNMFLGPSVMAPKTTMASATISSLIQPKFAVRKCSIRSNAPDCLAVVPETIGVDQEILSCITCQANESQEVHALLVDEPVPVGSLHSPQNNRHDDIDVYVKAIHKPFPVTLILASRKSVSWHIIADVNATPLKEVVLISPKGTERSLDVRWPHRTSPLALTSGQLSVEYLDADIGHLQGKDELERFFKVLGPRSFVTSLTSIHRTHVWRLDVGVKLKCSGYKNPFKEGWRCSGKTSAIIAVATCVVVSVGIVIIACVVYRYRRGKKSSVENAKEKNKPQTPEQVEYDELKFTDNMVKDEKLKENGTLPSGNFYFNPDTVGPSERLAQQEEMLRY